MSTLVRALGRPAAVPHTMQAPLLRTHLYAPGSNEKVLAKVFDRGADCVILDLEDAVAPSMKDTARDLVAQVVRERGPDAPCDVQVRINCDGDGHSETDLRAVVAPGLDAIRLPKTESGEQVAAVASLLDELETAAGIPAGMIGIYPIIESAVGAIAIPQIAAAPRVMRISIGTSDFLADIAATGPSHGPATDLTRGMLVLHSRANGIGAPVDSVHTDLDDEEGLVAGARYARDMGFFGKAIIHPKQIEPVHAVFTPTEDEIAEARAVIAAMEAADAEGSASIQVDGQFIDPAIVARATALLRLAER